MEKTNTEELINILNSDMVQCGKYKKYFDKNNLDPYDHHPTDERFVCGGCFFGMYLQRRNKRKI